MAKSLAAGLDDGIGRAEELIMRLRGQATRERQVLQVVRITAAGRVAIGVALTLMTRRLVRATTRDPDPSGPFLLFARTVGIRDGLFGLGCLLAAAENRHADLRRWIGLWAANEAADVVAAVTATRLLGRAGASIAAAPPLVFAAVDVWALRNLPRDIRA